MAINSRIIPNFPNYKIYEDGRIYNIKTGRLLKNQLKNHQYWKINLWNNSGPDSLYIHILLAEAFIPNPLKLPQVNHKDGIKNNFELSNLEWVTISQNSIHAFNNNLTPVPGSKLNWDLVREIRKTHGKLQIAADIFNVNKSTISKIRRNKTWVE